MIALPLPEPPLAGTRYGRRLWAPADASALAAWTSLNRTGLLCTAK